MCSIQHRMFAKNARAIAGVPHMRCRKNCFPHARPDHNSSPVLTNPGTITTGCFGVIPRAFARAPGPLTFVF